MTIQFIVRRNGRVWAMVAMVSVLVVVAAVGSREVGAYPTTNTFELQVTGQAGLPVDAEAVVLNVTATNTEAAGFVTVWPCGLSIPEASNLNFVAGRDVPNSVISRIGAGGKVCLKASANTNLIVDVAGYFPAGSDYEPSAAPTRILDTRNGTGAAQGLVAAGGTVRLQVGGRGGVPVDAEAAVLNLTAASTQEYGFVTAHPCDQPLPVASNLNFVAGQDVPNLVIARLAADGSVCLFTFGSTHLIADVAGYFPAGSDYEPIDNPTRLLDTRDGTGATTPGPVAARGIIELQVGGVGGVPPDALAVVLNATVAEPVAAGYATIFPCGQGVPDASNLNYAAGQNVANLVIARVGVGGKVCLFSYESTHLIVDVAGYFPAGSSYVPISTPTRILDSRTIPAPTTTTPPPPPTTPPPPPPLQPGTTLIGSGAPAGRYIARNAASGCYWERLSGLGGTTAEIIANDFQGFAGRIIVDIAATDLAFRFDADCGTFAPYTLTVTPATTIPPGDWVVGSEIVAGTYAATVASGCYWERVTSFAGTLGSIIANDFISTAGSAYVTVAASDIGFKTDADCGTWSRIG